MCIPSWALRPALRGTVHASLSFDVRSGDVTVSLSLLPVLSSLSLASNGKVEAHREHICIPPSISPQEWVTFHIHDHDLPAGPPVARPVATLALLPFRKVSVLFVG